MAVTSGGVKMEAARYWVTNKAIACALAAALLLSGCAGLIR